MECPMAIIPTGAEGSTTYTITNGTGKAVITIGGGADPAWTDNNQ